MVTAFPAAFAQKAPPASAAAEAQSNFNLQCSSCHGKDGAGDTPVGKSLNAADLRSKDIQKKSDAELAQVIADGRGNMPSFSDSLTREQIRALVAYLRKLARGRK
jgi:mono/diheme cytochrome c family protein